MTSTGAIGANAGDHESDTGGTGGEPTATGTGTGTGTGASTAVKGTAATMTETAIGTVALLPRRRL